MKTYQLVVGLALAAGLMAQPGPGGFGPGGFGPGGPQGAPTFTELKAYLTLTDAQVTSLQELRRQEAEAVRADRETMQTKHSELRAAVEKSDAETAGKLLIEIEAIRKRITDIHTRYYNSAVAVLTPAQKTKLQSLEEAAKLMPTIGQARALNLLTAPEPAAGAGPRGMGPGGMGMRPGGMGMGPGPMGFRPRTNR